MLSTPWRFLKPRLQMLEGRLTRLTRCWQILRTPASSTFPYPLPAPTSTSPSSPCTRSTSSTSLVSSSSSTFTTSYERVTRGMLHEDRLVFALLLTRIYLKSAPGELPMDPEFKVLLRGGEKGGIGQLAPIYGLTDEQTVAVYRLTTSLPAFKDLVAKCTNPGLATWLAQSNPEQDIPTSLEMWSSDTPITACQQSMYKLLLIQALRSDRLPAASNEFVAACLGQDFVKEAEKEPDMANVVETQIESTTPIPC